MKIPGLMLLVILLLIPACSGGSVPTQNVTVPPALPFISIDPLGNHALGEIFTISGTTNLPENQTIQIEIEADSPLVPKIGPGVFGGGAWYTTVVAGEGTATNRWSVAINISGYNQTLASSKNFLVRAVDVSTFNVTGTSEFGIAESYITIDPVGDHYIGDSFVVHGTAKMIPGEEILVEIRPALAEYSPGFGIGETRELGMAATAIVRARDSSLMEWTCPVNTARWAPFTYRIIVTPVNQKYGDSVSTQFNLTERPSLTQTAPAGNSTTSPASMQNFSITTTAATGNPPHEVPTTRPAPLPLAVSIAATGLGVIAIRGFRKK
jgi:hypothetical protein